MSSTLLREDLADKFNKYYIKTNNEADRIPTCIVFARLAYELNVDKLNPNHIKDLTEELDLSRKSVMFSNGSNGFVDNLRKNRYRTVTASLKEELINKYRDEIRVNLKSIIGIREKDPLLEPSNFEGQKLKLISIIVSSETPEELRARCLTMIDTIYKPADENEGLLSDYKQKNISINKTQTTIHFE